MYYTIAVCIIAFGSNLLVYFFPFREELANKNDLIATMITKSRRHTHHQNEDYFVKGSNASK